MDDSQVDRATRLRAEQQRADGLAAELWASALLIGLAVAATVGLALLAHLLLRSGS